MTSQYRDSHNLSRLKFKSLLILSFFSASFSQGIPPSSPPPPSLNATDASEVPLANVTLVNMTIYDDHSGFLDYDTNIYFRCIGEPQLFVPLVQDVNVSYSFNATETFQPLTTLAAEECKKCGLYEKDFWSSDDTFGEWIICSENFTYTPILHLSFPGQFNACLSCPGCHNTKIEEDLSGNGDSSLGVLFLLLVVFGSIIVVFLIVVFIGLLVLYARRQIALKLLDEERAKFIEMFDEEDDVAKDLDHL